jgi:flagellar hook-length control protein FliK
MPLFRGADQLAGSYAAYASTKKQDSDAGEVPGDLLSIVAGVPVTNFTGPTDNLAITENSRDASRLAAAEITANPEAQTAGSNTEFEKLGLSLPTSLQALTNGQADTAKSPAIVAAPSDFAAVVADKLAGTVKLESSTTSPEFGVLPATASPLMHTGAATQSSGSSEIGITPSMGTSHWESAIGNSLVFMAGNGRNHAELVLNPPQLGRIEVSVSVSGDQANAFFVSANPAVRDALENAMPRLREVFADAGITLGQAQVGSESPRQSANNGENNDNSPRISFSDLGDSLGTQSGTQGSSSTLRLIAARGLVDTFV